MSLPNFIIIGAMKAATTTLYGQLRQQRGIFMAEPKEPNFFSNDEQYARGSDWYQKLFADARPGDLIGEASTHYTKRPTYPATIRRMAALLKRPRLIYLMRHPIDRLVSQYIHEWSKGRIRCSLEHAIERHPELIHYSRYAFQLEPYFQSYGEQAVLPVFFERLAVEPQEELERVCRFIGYERQPYWDKMLAPRNISKERIRKFSFYDVLIDSKLARKLRHTLVPKSLRASIRQRLVVPERPVLSAAARSKLEQIFDSDLVALKDWLGRSITCQNFGA
jgi:hypothetical protein